ncbi:MAG TPA: DUF3821 domain-containing protein [Methanoregula sp.]|nr:DUF3821 domain-containing protein [Methanoregula sp.]
MKCKYIFCVLLVIFLVCSPVAAGTKKLVNGAPVFIGESDLDISSAIRDCKVIAWWADETNMAGPAVKNITVKRINDVVLPVNHFNISTDLFGGYPGNWYCEDKQPTFVVLRVAEPELSVRVWDLDNDKDITGKTVPVATNITYRIDTNLHQALGYYNRTDLNPADGFFTVKVTMPNGKQLGNIYTGNMGASTTQILSFDTAPFITTPVYYGRNLEAWNRLSRDESGGFLYPAGTYTFTVTQNLNQMQQAYPSSSTNPNNGKTISTATVTFTRSETPATAVTPAENTTIAQEPTTIVVTPQTTIPTVTRTMAPTEIPVTTKTTYSPLPLWIVVGAIGCAGFLIVRKEN